MRALVLGGTGAVGQAVLDGLAAEGVPTVFTYFRSEALARETSARNSQVGLRVDLRQQGALLDAIDSLQDPLPNVLIHAAVTGGPATFADLGEDDLDEILAVNARAPLTAARRLAPTMANVDRAAIVLIGGLATGQSIPAPVGYAASQGMLNTMTMALAKELGPSGVTVNLVSAGPLEAGLAQGLDPQLRDDFQRFSALRRLGRPDEVAQVVLWLALENTYMNGKIVPVNGGI